MPDPASWPHYFARPRYIPNSYGDRTDPWNYTVPDGPPVTVVGSTRAILVVSDVALGGEMDYLVGEPYPNFRPPGISVEQILKRCPAAGDVTTTVADMRAAFGEPLPSPATERAECPECGGTGTAECYACEREHDCDKCDGLGVIGGRPDYEPLMVESVNGQVLDGHLIAPLLPDLPDGAVSVRQERPNAAVYFVGDGWTLVAMPMNLHFTGGEPVKAKLSTTLLSA
jgi:hypothetical protein